MAKTFLDCRDILRRLLHSVGISHNPSIRAEAFMMLQEYAREYMSLCLVPAFFIAGAIAVFVSQAAYSNISVRKPINFYPIPWLPWCWQFVHAPCCHFFAESTRAAPASARLPLFLYSGPAITCFGYYSYCRAGN